MKPAPLSPLHRLPWGGLVQKNPAGDTHADVVSCGVRSTDTYPSGAWLWLLVTTVPVRPGTAAARGSAAVWTLLSMEIGAANWSSAMSLYGWPKAPIL